MTSPEVSSVEPVDLLAIDPDVQATDIDLALLGSDLVQALPEVRHTIIGVGVGEQLGEFVDIAIHRDDLDTVTDLVVSPKVTFFISSDSDIDKDPYSLPQLQPYKEVDLHEFKPQSTNSRQLIMHPSKTRGRSSVLLAHLRS